jgi:hypothetical protein
VSLAPIRHWSALLPLAMSIAALALVVTYVGSGGTREPDEGTAAHIWQLLMAMQVLLVPYFAFTWLPKAPRAALLILALQVAVVLANLALVRSFNL